VPFELNGFELIEDFISRIEIESIIRGLGALDLKGGGLRNAEKKLPAIAELIESEKYLSHASKYLSGKASLVRSIIFIKSIDNNWLVTWHQDKTVAISRRIDDPDWGPWSEKEGILHVQPPVEVLDQMVTFRVHLDESTEENGCLKLMPNSHRAGLMPQQLIDNYSKTHSAVSCIAPLGSVLVMRPHVLHASSKAKSANPRRVLHIEYSSYQLPSGVEWA